VCRDAEAGSPVLGSGGQGAGNFGIAYKGVSRVDDEVYAIKLIKIHRDGALDEIKSEAKILFPLVHKNIVRYFNSFLHTDSAGQLYYGLVMEYVVVCARSSASCPVGDPFITLLTLGVTAPTDFASKAT